MVMADDLSVTREGDTLVIRIPITAPTPSSSGKTLVVASTRGNQKMAVRRLRTSDFPMFSNVLRVRRLDSSLLIPCRFDPLAVRVAVRDASTSMNVKPALTSGCGRGSHLVEEAERVHAIRTYSSASWSGSGSAPHERGPRRRRRPPDVLVPSRDG